MKQITNSIDSRYIDELFSTPMSLSLFGSIPAPTTIMSQRIKDFESVSGIRTFPKELFDMYNYPIFFIQQPAHEPVPPHRHDYIEIEYVMSGTAIEKIEGKLLRLEQNSLCIFNKSVIHEVVNTTNDILMYHVGIHEDFFNSIPVLKNVGKNSIVDYLVYSLFINTTYSDYLLLNNFKYDFHILMTYLMLETKQDNRSDINLINYLTQNPHVPLRLAPP